MLVPTSTKNKLTRGFLLCFFSIAVLCHLAVALSSPVITKDTIDRYGPLSTNIKNGLGLVQIEDGKPLPDRMDQPGYPYFLAVTSSIPGEYRSVVIVQCLLELFAIFLTYRFTKLAGFPSSVQILTAAIALLCPILSWQVPLLMNEILVTFLTTGFMCLLLLAMTRRDSRLWFLAGVCGAACILTRGDMVVSLGLMSLFAVFSIWKKDRLPAFAASIGAICLGFLLVLAPWTYRNYREIGKLSPLGGAVEQTKWPYVSWLSTWAGDPKYLTVFWWNALDPAIREPLPPNAVPDVDRETAENAIASLKGRNDLVGYQDQRFVRLRENAVRTNPTKALIVVPLRRVAMTWIRMASQATRFRGIVRILWLLILALAIFGSYFCFLTNKPVFGLLFGLIVGRSVMPFLTIIGAEPRYLVEALPACFVFAACSLNQLLIFFKSRRLNSLNGQSAARGNGLLITSASP